MNPGQIADLERARASQRVERRAAVVYCKSEPTFSEVFWPFCRALVGGLFKWVGILVGGFVALVVALVVLVSWVNAPTPMWRCNDVVAESAFGEVHLRCAD